MQASSCLEKIESSSSQLTKELLLIEQIDKLLAAFDVEFKRINEDIDLLTERLQKNYDCSKIQVIYAAIFYLAIPR